MINSSCEQLHELIVDNIDKAGFDELNLLIKEHCKTCPECRKYSEGYNSFTDRLKRIPATLRYYKSRFANMKSVYKVLFYGADIILIILAYILLGHSCDNNVKIKYESGHIVQFNDADVFTEIRNSIDLLKDSYSIYNEATVKVDKLDFQMDGTINEVDYRVVTTEHIFYIYLRPNEEGVDCTIRYHQNKEQLGLFRFDSFDNVFSNMQWKSFENNAKSSSTDCTNCNLEGIRTLSESDLNDSKQIVRYRSDKCIIDNNTVDVINHTAIVLAVYPGSTKYLFIMD